MYRSHKCQGLGIFTPFPLHQDTTEPHFSLPLFLSIPVQNLIWGVGIRRVVLSSSLFGDTVSPNFELAFQLKYVNFSGS